MKRRAFADGENNQDIIELISCQSNGDHCAQVRGEINKLLKSARISRINKEYRKAVDEMVEAYGLTNQEINESCRACHQLFRDTIINSLSLVTNELKKMNSGLFRDKHYQQVYLFASKKLEELTKDHQA